MTSAIAYLRVSGLGQVEGDGFTRQRAAIKTYAEAAGLAICGEERDEGVSGRLDLEGRSGLAEALGAIEAGEAQVIVVENASRLARDALVGAMILAKIEEAGGEVHAADQGRLIVNGEDNPTGKLIQTLMMALAEWDRTMVVLKLRAARERKRLEGGRCEGAKPYGSREGEQPVRAMMEGLRAKHLTLDEIAAELNAAGYRNRRGNEWSGKAVGKILARAKPRRSKRR